MYACPACHSKDIFFFYEVREAPVHSVILIHTREEALSFPRGEISLGFCNSCGFISNYAFSSGLQNYGSDAYEATQQYSSTFSAFHNRLAVDLIERYQLRDKKIIEIGCGQGDFLTLLCEMGNNEGLGYDPAFTDRRLAAPLSEKVKVISDYYSEHYASKSADLTCCKMTLEHIHPVRSFVEMVCRAARANPSSRVFFQIPNAQYVLDTTAFWDIYYEHCSYFSPGTLARLFRSAGFEVIDLWTDYDDQYLMIDAVPATSGSNRSLPSEESLAQLAHKVGEFVQRSSVVKIAWQEKFQEWRQRGSKTVLWGGGSKAVSFLTTLGLGLEAIEYVVDVNPHKSGTYIAGTGQAIVHPDFLSQYQPDRVIVMNPIYMEEIRCQMEKMNLNPELMAIDSLQTEVTA